MPEALSLQEFMQMMKGHSLMRKPEKDLTEYLLEKGETAFAELVRPYRRNSIQIAIDKERTKIPVGASKFGGYPDLPPEIPYPTMSGYTCNWGNRSERYEESAMQLAAQINLADIAPYDRKNLLPHTGMLYFFWSGEIMNIHETNRYHESIADHPENTAYQKVIWYNGDLSALRRTGPPVPYYTKYFTEAFSEIGMTFSSGYEYPALGYELDGSQLEALSELAPMYDFECLMSSSNKLFGYPSGCNCPDVDECTHLLLQYAYNEGCLHNLFWMISDNALKQQDFGKVYFSVDLD